MAATMDHARLEYHQQQTNFFVGFPQSYSWRQAMPDGISQNVLKEIFKAYAAGEQVPSAQAIRELAAAAGWSEKAIMNEYHRAYRSAIGEDPWAPPQIL
jgi:hypothetical protein